MGGIRAQGQLREALGGSKEGTGGFAGGYHPDLSPGQAEFPLPGGPRQETASGFTLSPNEGSTSTPTAGESRAAEFHLDLFQTRDFHCHKQSLPSLLEESPAEKKTNSIPSLNPALLGSDPLNLLSHPCCHLDNFPVLLVHSSRAEKSGLKADGDGLVLIHHHTHPAIRSLSVCVCVLQPRRCGRNCLSWKKLWGLCWWDRTALPGAGGVFTPVGWAVGGCGSC